MFTINTKRLLAATGAIVISSIILTSCSNSSDSVSVEQGEIMDVKTMAQLCTIEIFCEVPVKETINNKELIGIQKQHGVVSFDLEALKIETAGDSVKLNLPPEIIEINEDASKDDAWKVVDTKSTDESILSVFKDDKLTNAEDNIIKERIKKTAIKRLYKEGIVETARKDGKNYLKELMEKVFVGKCVIVNDPTPKGAYFDKNK